MKKQFPNELLETSRTATAFVRAHRSEIEQAKENGWTWGQIADAVGIGRHALKTAYHRHRHRLKKSDRPGLRKSDLSRRPGGIQESSASTQAPKSPPSPAKENPIQGDSDKEYFSF
ncbi:hypothetical protein [Methylohalobius crimeensis]|uniref:hypothetical protein n=1 Tax=Methylohalobius crimeensis TaxID=244365 RepID=UPI0012691523|nr:hypothetical protein [Methylohalobius crimeensis]